VHYMELVWLFLYLKLIIHNSELLSFPRELNLICFMLISLRAGFMMFRKMISIDYFRTKYDIWHFWVDLVGSVRSSRSVF
jgi:hypothetical protein